MLEVKPLCMQKGRRLSFVMEHSQVERSEQTLEEHIYRNT